MRLLLYSFFLILNSTLLYGAQDTPAAGRLTVQYDTTAELSPPEIDPNKIEEYKKEKSFNYLEQTQQDSWWTRFKKWLDMRFRQFVDWLFGDYQAHALVAFLLNLLPYLLIGAIAAFVVWLFIRLNPGESILGSPKEPAIYFTEEEEIVHSKDISELIEIAISRGNYRLAIRYYYLRLLRELNEKGLITYEYQKTNTEYLAEVKEENYRLPLKKVMRLYDFIWYGNFPVTGEDFARAQTSFKELDLALKPIRNE